ncbi:MAG: AAA family ATPase [Planctomycetaceae bacterium]|nr:AAA family ATPase [Planctomycetaceae bacterium]
MYESHFGLSRRPFAFAPQVEQYFPGRAIESARQTLVRCIERAEGIGLVIGPTGTGKSLLLQVLAARFRSTFSVALLANSHLPSRRALLQAILFELGLPYRGMDEGELRLSLIDHITDGASHGMLLLIDEAHLLPLRLLEEIRMIANVARQGQPQVRIVLAGGAALEERLTSPKLTSFAQRLSARCYLESLDLGETIAYVRAQLSTAGGNANAIFSELAMETVFRATDGVPRLINQLCDHALVLAYAGGQERIDVAGIEEAWADLQQLPTPWNEVNRFDVPAAGQDGVVEFGVLGEANDSDEVEPTMLRLESIAAAEPAEPEFVPQARQTSEVELTITSTTDPFAETFAEEEVIMNPYAAIDETRLARTRVHSTEGKQMAAMLEPFLSESVPPMALPTPPVAPPVVQEPVSISPTITLALSDGPASLGIHQPSPSIAFNSQLPPPGEWIVSESRPVETLRWSEPNHAGPNLISIDAPRAAAQPATGGDQSMIVVDEDPEPARPTPKLTAPVRRQEYRQLFAQLRRS